MKTSLYIMLFCLSAGIVSCQDQTGAANAKTTNSTITVDEFERKLSGDVQLIDVRTAEEFDQGHLKGALNYDVNSSGFQTRLASLDKDKPVLVYCLSGGRSAAAANIMAGKGFVQVYNMQGGTMKWSAANKPMEAGTAAINGGGMTLTDFNERLASDKYVLVDYNAKWCRPCKKMAPMLEAFIEKRKDKMLLLKIDADENKNLLKQKSIESLPVLELYKNGKLLWKHEGEIDETTLIKEINL